MKKKNPTRAVAFCGTMTPCRRVWYLDAKGGEHPLPARLELFDHSPDGFAWGYGGSGPSQLALAILAQVAGPKAATIFYQYFKADFVCGWGDDFRISAAEVEEWVERKWGEMSPDWQADTLDLAAFHISCVNEKRRAAKSPTLSTRLPTYLKRTER